MKMSIIPGDSGPQEITPIPPVDALLLEDGTDLLLEDGTNVLLE